MLNHHHEDLVMFNPYVVAKPCHNLASLFRNVPNHFDPPHELHFSFFQSDYNEILSFYFTVLIV